MINAEFDDSYVRQQICVDLKARIRARGSTKKAFETLRGAANSRGFVTKDDYVKILMGMELAHDRSDHARFFHGIQRQFGNTGDPGIRYGAFLKYVSGLDRKRDPQTPTSRTTRSRAKPVGRAVPTVSATTAAALPIPRVAGVPSGGTLLRSSHRAAFNELASPASTDLSKSRNPARVPNSQQERIADRVVPRRQLVNELAVRMRALSTDPAVVERKVAKAVAARTSSSSNVTVLRSWRDLRAILSSFNLRVSDVQVRELLNFLQQDKKHLCRHPGPMTLARLVELVHGDACAALQEAINAATMKVTNEIQLRDANRFASEVRDPSTLRTAIQNKVAVLGNPWRAFVKMSNEGATARIAGSKTGHLAVGIDLKGFRRAIEYLQIVATRAAIKRLFVDIDADQSGFIEHGEFIERLFDAEAAAKARQSVAAAQAGAAAAAQAADLVRSKRNVDKVKADQTLPAIQSSRALQPSSEPSALARNSQDGAGLSVLRRVFHNQGQSPHALLKLFKIFQARDRSGPKITTATWKPAADKGLQEQVQHGVSFNGFKAALRACSAELTDEDIRQAFVACDINSDGVIDFMEFAKAAGIESKGFEYGTSKLTPNDSIVRRLMEQERWQTAHVGHVQNSRKVRSRSLKPGALVVEQYKERVLMARRVLDVFSMDSREATIDFSTFDRGVSQLGMELTVKEKRELFRRLDPNHDGVIDYNEFSDGILSGQIALTGFDFSRNKPFTKRIPRAIDSVKGRQHRKELQDRCGDAQRGSVHEEGLGQLLSVRSSRRDDTKQAELNTSGGQRTVRRGRAFVSSSAGAGSRAPFDADTKLLQGLTQQLLVSASLHGGTGSSQLGGSVYIPRRKSDALDVEVRKKQHQRSVF